MTHGCVEIHVCGALKDIDKIIFLFSLIVSLSVQILDIGKGDSGKKTQKNAMGGMKEKEEILRLGKEPYFW